MKNIKSKITIVALTMISIFVLNVLESSSRAIPDCTQIPPTTDSLGECPFGFDIICCIDGRAAIWFKRIQRILPSTVENRH